jgi:hypothetical protein
VSGGETSDEPGTGSGSDQAYPQTSRLDSDVQSHAPESSTVSTRRDQDAENGFGDMVSYGNFDCCSGCYYHFVC